VLLDMDWRSPVAPHAGGQYDRSMKIQRKPCIDFLRAGTRFLKRI
jgi:hypothetical protein